MKVFRIALAAAACSAALAALPAAASGAASAAPPTLDFGSSQIGTAAPAKPVTVTVTCAGFIGSPINSCITGPFDALTVNPSATGDFSVANGTCPGTLQPTTTSSVSCVLDVTFNPTAAGPRTGTLATGTVFPAIAGPTVALTGVGTAAAAPVNAGTGGSTAVPGITPKGKKCKKKKGKKAGAAAKKCKKKKKK